MKTCAKILVLLFTFCGTITVHADRRPASSTSGNAKQINLPLPWTELTGGTTNFTQTLDNTHTEHPLGFHVSAHSRAGAFQFGVGVLGAVHGEQQQSGTYSQVNINESAYLETFNVGLILGDFIILDGGYGFAQMRRSVSNPYATPSTTVNTTANGLGWTLGGSIIPFRTKTASLGLSYYYFDATSTSYSQDNAVGNTQTTTSAPAKVHASGSLAGITILLNY
jgi:hypothetical protein